MPDKGIPRDNVPWFCKGRCQRLTDHHVVDFKDVSYKTCNACGRKIAVYYDGRGTEVLEEGKDRKPDVNSGNLNWPKRDNMERAPEYKKRKPYKRRGEQ